MSAERLLRRDWLAPSGRQPMGRHDRGLREGRRRDVERLDLGRELDRTLLECELENIITDFKL